MGVGIDVYEEKTEAAIAELRSLASRLNKAAKEHAAVQVAAAAASAAAATAGACAAAVGVIAAPFTFGASLALTAVGVAATVVGVAAGAATLVNNMVKQGVTNAYVTKLKAEHLKAGTCTADMVKLSTALEESKYEAGHYFASDSWISTMEEIGKMPELTWQEDIKNIVDLYGDAVATLAPTMSADELEKLVKSPITGHANVNARNVAKGTVGIMKTIKGCKS